MCKKSPADEPICWMEYLNIGLFKLREYLKIAVKH